MIGEGSPRAVKEQPFLPVVVHYKTLEFIHGHGGFKDILSQIPSFTQAAKFLDHSFWDFGGTVNCKIGESELSVSLELNGAEGKTVLDVELDSPNIFKNAFLTFIEPAPDEEKKDAERSCFLYNDGAVGQPLLDTPTASEKIKELQDELKSFIPSPA